jgi:spore coat protein U-like protein
MKPSNILKYNLSAAILGCLALGFNCASAAAATATTTFAVTANVQATCLISATALTFGPYTGALVNGTSTVSVTCTNGTTYNIGFNQGLGTGSTVTTRKMTGPGSAVLEYDLFSDSARSTNWGQTVGSDTIAGTGNGSTSTLTVYGQVTSAQYVTPGAFTDTVTATVTY